MFRFTIRDLVLVTLVVALGVGWWIDSRASDQAQATLHERVAALDKRTEMLKREALAEVARRIELQAELNLMQSEYIRLQIKRKTAPETASRQP
jgi:hypothetical protein